MGVEKKFRVTKKCVNNGKIFHRFIYLDEFDYREDLFEGGVYLILGISQFTGEKDKNENEIYENDNFDVSFADIGSDKIINVLGKVVSFMGQYMIQFTHPIYNDIRYTNLFEFLRNGKEKTGNCFQ